MAGRGRGRGRGLTFDIEKLGFGRGDALPAASYDPPPIFPPLQFKCVPLLTGESYDYLLALKQELRGTFRDSGYFVPAVTVKKDVQRYSDKYQQLPASDTIKWDWAYFPKELMPKTKLKRKKKTTTVAKKLKTEEVDLKEKFNELEKREASGSEEEKDEKEDEEGEVEDEEMYDEEDLEEGTDYASNYFDNGENYIDDEDDNLDEPTY